MFQLFDERTRMSHALTGIIKELGRSDGCDIAFPEDTSVSRVHARLDRDGEDWILVDLGSTNGTFVNGQRVVEARLRAGDVIELGDTRLRFLPLQIEDRAVQKKTTNVSIRRAEVQAGRPKDPTSVFTRVKTALRKRDSTDDSNEEGSET